MILIDTLSHMPFQADDVLYFCKSRGLAEFAVAPTAFSEEIKAEPQKISYQPWTLAKMVGGVITPIGVGMPAKSPMHLYCNPVVVGDTISFIYNRCLWSSPLLDSLVPSIVRNNVYTGFVGENITVYSDLKTPNTFVIASAGGNEVVETIFTSILRIVPSEANLIITGNLGSDTFSLLRHPNGDLFRIQVGGQDVYKCCLVGDDVIHAVKAGEFETRYLHKDPVELVPYE